MGALGSIQDVFRVYSGFVQNKFKNSLALVSGWLVDYLRLIKILCRSFSSYVRLATGLFEIGLVWRIVYLGLI